MKTFLSISIILFVLILSTAAQQTKDESTFALSLVEAERAFAKASVDKGMRAAFIEYLADNAIVFQPGPVNGQKWWSAQPVRPGLLTWRPIFVYVAPSNDMGYTTGPWEFRPKSLDDKPVAHGNFVSIWKRQKGGVWKVTLDIGTDNPAPQTSSEEVIIGSGFPHNEKGKATANRKDEMAQLLNTNEDFSKLLSTKRPIDSLLVYLADDVRLFRMNEQPVIGKQAALDALVSRPGTLSRLVSTGDVSRSGDLGYTYGSYDFEPAADTSQKESGNYLRIWRKLPNEQWKIVLDLVKPNPPPPTK